MRRFLRSLRWPVLVLAVLLLGLTVFFTRYQSLARGWQTEYALDYSAANAVKHAYTAAQLYHLFRSVGVGAQTAQAIVLELGICSERAENTYRFERYDTNLELMKDLYNNQVGVTAARWHEHTPQHGTQLAQIIWLLKHDVLVSAPEKTPIASTDVALADEKTPTSAIFSWFRQQRPIIAERTETALKQQETPE